MMTRMTYQRTKMTKESNKDNISKKQCLHIREHRRHIRKQIIRKQRRHIRKQTWHIRKQRRHIRKQRWHIRKQWRHKNIQTWRLDDLTCRAVPAWPAAWRCLGWACTRRRGSSRGTPHGSWLLVGGGRGGGRVCQFFHIVSDFCSQGTFLCLNRLGRMSAFKDKNCLDVKRSDYMVRMTKFQEN